MISGVKRLRENIKRGKLGKNIGISTGMPKLDSIIYGIQRKYLYTVGTHLEEKLRILLMFLSIMLLKIEIIEK